MSLLIIAGLSKSYGAPVLQQIDLRVESGEILCLLGPSGCGKTTLLRIVAGLEEADEGSIRFDGAALAAIPVHRRGFGLMFQEFALFPHLTVAENIAFGLQMAGWERPRQRQRVAEMLDLVNLEGYDSRSIFELSGGERQRVALARSLAPSPRLLMLDEPLGSLDRTLREELMGELRRILKRVGVTALYVTHDQTEAVALADRIAVMRSGKIEQVGTFEALYERPVNAFVAQFFGLPPMNLFPGRVYGESWEGSRFGVKPIRPGLEHGQRTLLGIRPEHVQVVDQGIPARIEHIEFNFPERRKLLYLALGEFRCVASVPLEAPGKRGERVQLAFPAEHIFLFDEASGQRVG